MPVGLTLRRFGEPSILHCGCGQERSPKAPPAFLGGEAGNSSGALGSSSSGAAPAAGFDMRIFSSQIQEWLVEFSCDKLFITIRTDVAWYRLARYGQSAQILG